MQETIKGTQLNLLDVTMQRVHQQETVDMKRPTPASHSTHIRVTDLGVVAGVRPPKAPHSRYLQRGWMSSLQIGVIWTHKCSSRGRMS